MSMKEITANLNKIFSKMDKPNPHLKGSLPIATDLSENQPMNEKTSSINNIFQNNMSNYNQKKISPINSPAIINRGNNSKINKNSFKNANVNTNLNTNSNTYQIFKVSKLAKSVSPVKFFQKEKEEKEFNEIKINMRELDSNDRLMGDGLNSSKKGNSNKRLGKNYTFSNNHPNTNLKLTNYYINNEIAKKLKSDTTPTHKTQKNITLPNNNTIRTQTSPLKTKLQSKIIKMYIKNIITTLIKDEEELKESLPSKKTKRSISVNDEDILKIKLNRNKPSMHTQEEDPSNRLNPSVNPLHPHKSKTSEIDSNTRISKNQSKKTVKDEELTNDIENLTKNNQEEEKPAYSGEAEILKLSRNNISKISHIVSRGENSLPLSDSPRKSTSSRCIKRYPNVYDSYSEEEYESEDLDNHQNIYTINEKSNWKKTWDILMLLCILFSCTIDPYILAFSIYDLEKLEAFMDIIFILDIVFNFFTPYYIEDIVIRNHKKIITYYLSKWFLFDAMTSLPTSLISVITSNPNQVSKVLFRYPKVDVLITLRWFRVLRVLKLLKSDNIGQIVSNLKFINDSGINRLLKFGLLFLILSHISTCLWIHIGLSSTSELNWINFYSFNNMSKSDIYVASAYFNFVTIFTIGYGDITAKNVSERLYLILFMMIGVMLFSFAVSSLSTIFSRSSERSQLLNQKLDTLYEIHRDYSLPSPLYDQIKKYIYFKGRSLFTSDMGKVTSLLDILPYSLRKEVVLSMLKMNRKEIHEIDFFRNQDREFIIYCLPLMKSLRVARGDTLIAIGDHVEEMYIVLSGVLSVRLNKFYQNLEIAQIRKNSHFGEVFMYLNESSHYNVNCKSETCDLLSLKKEDFTQVKLCFNGNILQVLHHSCQLMERIEKIKNVVMELYNNGLCGGNLKMIKQKLKTLNHFLLNKNFEHSQLNSHYEEPEDFILSHDIDEIIRFMNTQMTEQDYKICFINSQLKTDYDVDSVKSQNHYFSEYSPKTKRLKSINETFDEDDANIEEEKESYNNLMSSNLYMNLNLNKNASTRKFSNTDLIANRNVSKKISENNVRKDLVKNTVSNSNVYSFSQKMDLIQQELEIQQKMSDVLYINNSKGNSNANSNTNTNANANVKNSSKTAMSYSNKNIPNLNLISQSNSPVHSLKKPIRVGIKNQNRISSKSSKKLVNNFEIGGTYNIFNIYNSEDKIFRNDQPSKNELSIIQNENFDIISSNANINSGYKSDTLSVSTAVSYQYSDSTLFSFEVENEHNSNNLADLNSFIKMKNFPSRSRNNSLFGNLLSEIDRSSPSRRSILKKHTTVICKSADIVNKKSITKKRFRSNSQVEILEIKGKNRFKEDKEGILKDNLFKDKDNVETTKSFRDKEGSVSKDNINTGVKSTFREGNFNNSLLSTHSVTNSNIINLKQLSHQNPLTHNSSSNNAHTSTIPKRRIPILSKENLFDKVNSGLQLDELYHLDKFILMSNINNFIQQNENHTKAAKKCFKKLDKLFLDLKVNYHNNKKTHSPSKLKKI